MRGDSSPIKGENDLVDTGLLMVAMVNEPSIVLLEDASGSTQPILIVCMPGTCGASLQVPCDLKRCISLSIALIHPSSRAHYGDQIAMRADIHWRNPLRT